MFIREIKFQKCAECQDKADIELIFPYDRLLLCSKHLNEFAKRLSDYFRGAIHES